MASAREYESAYSRLIAKTMEGFVAADPLVGDIRRHRTKHGGPSRNVPGNDPLDHDQVCVSFQATFALEATRGLDVEAHTTFLSELGKSHVDSMATMLLRHVGDVCSAAGNSIDAGGAALTHDLLLDLIDKVDIQFDENGEAIMPSLVIHPDTMRKLMEQPQTEAHRHRHADIMARKKERWLANQRSRKLGCA